MTLERGTATARQLGGVAGVLGVLAAFAGSPYAEQQGRIDVPALARTVVREEDLVSAVELARWIKERREGLRVVDLRPQAEFESYHLPSAERITLDSLAGTPFRRSDMIVLYSDAGARAAQGCVFLRALGYQQVYFLRGGLNEWLDDVMNPSISENVSAAERAAFDSAAALSRYFGGLPRTTVGTFPLPPAGRIAVRRGPQSGSAATAVQRLRRRSC